MKQMLIDCTELYSRPIRSGVQRVVRQIIKNWPSGGPLLFPVHFDPQRGLVSLPISAVDLLTEREPGSGRLSYSDLKSRLLRTEHQAGPVLPEGAPVFTPEIFYDSTRCEFYEQKLKENSEGLIMLAYDFLPYVHPELFEFKSMIALMPYLRLLSRASHVAFISNATREEFSQRVLRKNLAGRDLGPALELGADGLSCEQQRWHPERRAFVSFGSLEPRKNQALIVEVFVSLWESGHDIPLILIGRKFHERDFPWLNRARDFRQFHWIDEATDREICEALHQARATIFMSVGEGYGLPPVESLAAGVPVLVYSGVPSVANLHDAGQIRLSAPNKEQLREAVIRMQDDRVAEQLWDEASTQRLTTWAEFSERLAGWCAGLPEPAKRSYGHQQPYSQG